MLGLGLAIPEIAVRRSGGGTSWNPADKAANLALSNNNLTLTGLDGNYGNVRSIAAASSGKRYWEVLAVTSGNPASTVPGFGDASATLTSFLGFDGHSVGWAGDGRILGNSTTVTTIQAWAQGNTLCFAIDIDNALLWCRTNGGNWNNSGAANPATGTGGISISGMIGSKPWFAIGESLAAPDVVTANFGRSPFAQAAPTGFGTW